MIWKMFWPAVFTYRFPSIQWFRRLKVARLFLAKISRKYSTYAIVWKTNYISQQPNRWKIEIYTIGVWTVPISFLGKAFFHENIRRDWPADLPLPFSRVLNRTWEIAHLWTIRNGELLRPVRFYQNVVFLLNYNSILNWENRLLYDRLLASSYATNMGIMATTRCRSEADRHIIQFQLFDSLVHEVIVNGNLTVDSPNRGRIYTWGWKRHLAEPATSQ